MKADTFDERKLVARCLTGEETAWIELVRRYSPYVSHAVRSTRKAHSKTAQTEPDAEDLVATVFARLCEDDYRRLREFQWECSLSTWLFLTAVRLTRNHLQKERAEQKRLRTILEETLSRESSPEPLEQLSQQERREWLRKALSTLSDEESRLLMGLYFRDQSYEELSRDESIPLGTVSSRVTSAKKKLLAFLREKLPSILL